VPKLVDKNPNILAVVGLDLLAGRLEGELKMNPEDPCFFQKRPRGLRT
jgi:hypothetical protein